MNERDSTSPIVRTGTHPSPLNTSWMNKRRTPNHLNSSSWFCIFYFNKQHYNFSDSWTSQSLIQRRPSSKSSHVIPKEWQFYFCKSLIPFFHPSAHCTVYPLSFRFSIPGWTAPPSPNHWFCISKLTIPLYNTFLKVKLCDIGQVSKLIWGSISCEKWRYFQHRMHHACSTRKGHVPI